MDEAKVREKYLELQMVAEQVKQMQSQLQTVALKKQELSQNIESLGEISGLGPSTMLVPVIEGVFVKAMSTSPNEVIVNVGAGVCVKKTVEEARELLNGKLAELAQFERDMVDEIGKGAESVNSLERELSGMIESAEQKNV